MKLNKYILSFVMLCLSIPATYGAEAYYCQYKDNNNTYHSSMYYDDARECDIWKSENMRHMNPGVYEDCMQDHVKYQQSLANGGCIPLYKESMSTNNGKCYCLLSHKHKKVYAYNCNGSGDIFNTFKQKLKTKYPDYKL